MTENKMTPPRASTHAAIPFQRREKLGQSAAFIEDECLFAITALVTLFVVVDPVGLAPTFLAVTEGLPRRARRDVAVRSTIIARVILGGTALVGDLLFRALGISLRLFASPAACCCSPSHSRWCWACACAAKVRRQKKRSRSMCAISRPSRSPSR